MGTGRALVRRRGFFESVHQLQALNKPNQLRNGVWLHKSSGGRERGGTKRTVVLLNRGGRPNGRAALLNTSSREKGLNMGLLLHVYLNVWPRTLLLLELFILALAKLRLNAWLCTGVRKPANILNNKKKNMKTLRFPCLLCLLRNEATLTYARTCT